MTRILVTGSTGQLGRPTTARLKQSGHDIRALSRTPGEGRLAADLLTGAGVAAALDGVDTVVHLATTNGSTDKRMIANLLSAAAQAGVGNFVLVSIVGVDRIPLGFYRDRLAIETAVIESGLPFTIQRATQFHSFVDGFLTAQKWLPLLVVPSIRVQPIAVDDVAERLTSLAIGAPQGRVADIGGPQVSAVGDLAAAWQRAIGSRRRSLPLRLPGKTFAALTAGEGLAPEHAEGRGTFEQYLTEKYGPAVSD